MSDPKIDLNTPWIAGLLAYLIPGAGHFYQRRYFKAVLYFVCVFGTFLYGMQLGDWKVVYWTENPGADRFGQTYKRNYGYLAQVGVGIPSLYAIAQSRRYRQPENQPVIINSDHIEKHAPLTTEIEADFTGYFLQRDPHDPGNRKDIVSPVKGVVSLKPRNRIFEGTIKGTIENEDGTTQPFEYGLGESLFLDSKVLGDSKRTLTVNVFNPDGQYIGRLAGSIPRSFADWFEAPLDAATLQNINNDLNKRFEMALVFTWIAGLLNILVIWDAMQGPAYGYDDEQLRQSREAKDEPKAESDKVDSASAAVEANVEEGDETQQPEAPPPSEPIAAPSTSDAAPNSVEG